MGSCYYRTKFRGGRVPNCITSYGRSNWKISREQKTPEATVWRNFQKRRRGVRYNKDSNNWESNIELFFGSWDRACSKCLKYLILWHMLPKWILSQIITNGNQSLFPCYRMQMSILQSTKFFAFGKQKESVSKRFMKLQRESTPKSLSFNQSWEVRSHRCSHEPFYCLPNNITSSA